MHRKKSPNDQLYGVADYDDGGRTHRQRVLKAKFISQAWEAVVEV
jgi:hypothetical protein